MSTKLVRSVHFECIHRYENPEWTEEKNAAVFGACFTPNGHGHSYKMDVYVEGPIATETGMVINLKDLDVVLRSVVELVDKKHLNFEIEEFKRKIPTTENLARFLFEKMRPAFSRTSVQVVKIRLYETDDLWVDESGSQ
jgi:6-pyruvoyltetrahydropterin/6-carboxytetrahydropterin synthase